MRTLNVGNAQEMANFCRSLAGSDRLNYKIGAVTDSGMADVHVEGKDITLVFHTKAQEAQSIEDAAPKRRGRPKKAAE
jgi:hypothetical protein|tara:strand:+ start:383 stop:616 length:234 start_codon:yes stop_codon:yes gene_type:complete